MTCRREDAGAEDGRRGRSSGGRQPACQVPGGQVPDGRWIGVDGGGTRSRALVGDAHGRELGTADGGPGLIDPSDPAGAVAAVTEVVRAAAAAAQVPLPVRGLWAGLAGAGESRARAAVEEALGDAGLAERVAVGTDVEAAHADAFGAGQAMPQPGSSAGKPSAVPGSSPSGASPPPGILCVVGTGSSVRAVGPRGDVVQVGGWGQLLGDEGSGYRIGLDGLRAVMRASDGREPRTSLSAVLLDAVSAAEPRDLVGWAARASKGQVAALSVLVAGEGRNGDPVAARIVHRALGAIRAHLEAALERTPGWGMPGRHIPPGPHNPPGSPNPPTVAFVGGLVQDGSVLREAVAAIAAELGCAVHPGLVVPERGALRHALLSTSRAR